MTDVNTGGALTPEETAVRVAATLKRRGRSERRFRYLGVGAVSLTLCFLVFLFTGILSKGIPGMLPRKIDPPSQIIREGFSVCSCRQCGSRRRPW